MSAVPNDLRYTKEHEWVKVISETVVRVGITDYAQSALGDIVYLSLPAVGTSLAAGQTCGEVESTKSVSDIYAPLDGVVKVINDAAVTEPSVINSSPYEAGWLIELEVPSASIAETLLDANAYLGLTST
ncbi:MAG: glycine cleavage system protein GcvH [Actinobacteria bacterium]|nr:glycine cleavage system protein GcvH [Actinomycetota bacterium]